MKLAECCVGTAVLRTHFPLLFVQFSVLSYRASFVAEEFAIPSGRLCGTSELFGIFFRVGDSRSASSYPSSESISGTPIASARASGGA